MKKRRIRQSAVAVTAVCMSVIMPVTCGFAYEGTFYEEEAGVSFGYSWADSIDEMLSGREYVEGEVIVVYDNSLRPQTALSEYAEEIATASGESAEEAFEGINVRETEDAVSIRVITSDEKTTRELLEILAGDPAVISAEPNYIIETADPIEATDNEEEVIALSPDDEEISENIKPVIWD